jgi:hypothetical protein
MNRKLSASRGEPFLKECFAESHERRVVDGKDDEGRTSHGGSPNQDSPAPAEMPLPFLPPGIEEPGQLLR